MPMSCHVMSDDVVKSEVKMQAARMLHYLGDHILMLTSMNLRDYLRLKVEIQGTSGEGSKAVKAFR